MHLKTDIFRTAFGVDSRIRNKKNDWLSIGLVVVDQVLEKKEQIQKEWRDKYRAIKEGNLIPIVLVCVDREE